MDLWKQICRQWNLGEIQMQPYPLSGGFLHKMYGLSTDTGKYAVKLLNPHIMQRPKAIDNYRRAEVLEEILEERGIPVLTAKKLHGNKMQQVDGQYYYLFPWYPGRVLKEEEVQKFHCGKIGETLARIDVYKRQVPQFLWLLALLVVAFFLFHALLYLLNRILLEKK